MMPELLFLLLPVAAMSGWLLARAGIKKNTDQQTGRAYEPDYYKGLNFLLNEQPDKAIDVFIHLLEVDSETVETHLALGSLFRKRGEVDRAIRIHQNLIARPSLDQAQRSNALLELGQDYMYAGLFDRAENLFTELYETGKLQVKALQNLKEIYQQEKVWDKCLQVVKKLESYTHKSYSEEIAQYYCELAEEAKKAGDAQKAAELIRKAKQSNPASVRASMMEAGLEVSQENYKKALRLYSQIINDDPLFAAEILPKIVICYRQTSSQAALLDFLNNLFEKTRDTAVLGQIVELINQSEGYKQAIDYLLIQLEKMPSLQGLQYLTAMQSQHPDFAPDRISNVLQKILSAELSSRPAYSCKRCGFSAKTLHWQCPGCRSWGTIKPAHDHDHTSLSGVTV